MSNRRTFVSSLAGTVAALAVGGMSRATSSIAPDQAPPGSPIATVIQGKPPVLDFGDGVRVPCNKEAFLTLWEGKTYWLAFGAGQASLRFAANGQAVDHAKASMTALLLTRAFAADRLEQVEGSGWRLKSGNIRDFVRGDLALPGNPFWPVNDAKSAFGSGMVAVIKGVGATMEPTWTKVDAFAAYVILKKDLSLDDVRKYAQVLPS